MGRDVLLVVLVGLALLGAVPLATGAAQNLLVMVHGWRNPYRGAMSAYLPRVAVLVPAWNEADVLANSIDHLLSLDYPRDRLRVLVIDDASTDDTPQVMEELAVRHPGAVVHLRRDIGGEGKSHTLNAGLDRALADDWAEAVLITDADVVFEPGGLRALARHLADPEVGAVTAYIKEGSRPGTAITRFVAYEYAAAQAAARRAQNVLGALACLAGGAQLHSRANLEALGGRIDTGTQAEDTVTTLATQLDGRRAVFEPHAVAWAEEPGTLTELWAQRLRWARGNVQVSRRFRHVWFHRAVGPVGGVAFGLIWFSTLLLPLLMILSSAALVALHVLDPERSQDVFRSLWVISGLSYLFLTLSNLAVDPAMAQRSWRQAFLFPGVVSLVFIVASFVPGPFVDLLEGIEDVTGLSLSDDAVRLLMVAAYVWVSACMVAAWLLMRLDRAGGHRVSRGLLYLVGFGPVLCAVTFAAYVDEARHREQLWEKTVKTGKVAIRA